MLGSLIGIVVVGGIDRSARAGPALRGRASGYSRSARDRRRPRARRWRCSSAGDSSRGSGPGTVPPIAYVAIGRSLPERLRPQMFATLSTAWVLPGVIGPAVAGARRRDHRLALGVPWPAPAHRDLGRDRHPAGSAGRPRRGPRSAGRCDAARTSPAGALSLPPARGSSCGPDRWRRRSCWSSPATSGP